MTKTNSCFSNFPVLRHESPPVIFLSSSKNEPYYKVSIFNQERNPWDDDPELGTSTANGPYKSNAVEKLTATL